MPTIYSDVPLSSLSRHKFLSPFLPSASNPNPDTSLASKNKKLINFVCSEVLPTLTPALQKLGVALEKDKTNDDVLPPRDDDDMDVDSQSMVSLENTPPYPNSFPEAPPLTLFSSQELKIFLAHHVNRALSNGLEDTYRAKTDDPLDHLAKFLFAASQDEVLNPEFDESVNPLHFLAQQLMRENPLHKEKHIPPPHPSPHELAKRTFNPPSPKPSSFAPSRSIKDGDVHEYDVPRSHVGLVSNDCEKEVVGVLERNVANIGVGGKSKSITITAIRHREKKTVLFRAIDTASFKKYDRLLNEEQLKLMVPVELRENGLSGAVRTLLERATLVRVCRGLQISFIDTPELSTPPPTLFQTSKQFDGRLFIIDVLSEPPLSTNQEGKEEDEHSEYLLLRCRLYDPEFSRYYEATRHKTLPRLIKERKESVSELVEGLTIVEVDEHTSRPMRFGWNEKKEEAKEAARESSLKKKFSEMNLHQHKLASWDKSHRSKFESLSSPRLDSALNDARSLGGADVYPLEAVRSSATASFDVNEVNERETVWQLRRDHALIKKRQKLQKRVGGGWKKKKGTRDLSVIVFRKGMKISGRRMIVSVEVFNETINGTLRITAYDPENSEAFELVLQHWDTRGLVGEKEGAVVKGIKEKALTKTCKNLRLVRTGGGVGPRALILWEADVWKGKLKKAFDLLPADFMGRVERENVIDCLRGAKRGIKSFLEGIHDDMHDYAVQYIDEIIDRAER